MGRVAAALGRSCGTRVCHRLGIYLTNAMPGRPTKGPGSSVVNRHASITSTNAAAGNSIAEANNLNNEAEKDSEFDSIRQGAPVTVARS